MFVAHKVYRAFIAIGMPFRVFQRFRGFNIISQREWPFVRRVGSREIIDYSYLIGGYRWRVAALLARSNENWEPNSRITIGLLQIEILKRDVSKAMR